MLDLQPISLREVFFKSGVEVEMTTIRSVSRKEFEEIGIRVWHFEKCDRGVIPVKGEYDPSNPTHVPKRKVIAHMRT